MRPASTDARLRLDQLLVDRGLFATRSRARDAIARGRVKLDGRVETKAGRIVLSSTALDVDDPAQGYVSRAALKLIAALDAFGLDPAGRICLDIGASTGGFTQVLLQRGAAAVFALDVGHSQLHESLRDDLRVTVLEGLNGRDLKLEHLGGAAPDFLVSDVSFISLRLALPPALALSASGCLAAFLVKPQFEAGREAIGKGGILRDPARGEEIAAELSGWLDGRLGWRSLGWIASPIEGGDGNREFLLAGTKTR